MNIPTTGDDNADMIIRVEDHVGWIILNRPHRQNAFTPAMLSTWATALRDFQRDDQIRVVALCGRGRSFCSGADLTDLSAVDRTPLGSRRLMTDHVHEVARAVADLTKPLVAGVHGSVVGAGMDMALMCDYRIASDDVRLSEGYIRVGLVPGDGGCFFLPRLIGRSRALRLLWTGEFIDAELASAWGVVDEVCLPELMADRLAEFAGQLASAPPASVQMIKTAVNQSESGDLRSALDLIASHQAVAMSTADSAEALSAFTQHRKPVFEGH